MHAMDPENDVVDQGKLYKRLVVEGKVLIWSEHGLEGMVRPDSSAAVDAGGRSMLKDVDLLRIAGSGDLV